jgi:hypothetical protein
MGGVSATGALESIERSKTMTYHAIAQADPAPRHSEPTPPSHGATAIREQLDATTQAVVAADEAHLRHYLESVRWERRGLLRRLTRGPAASKSLISLAVRDGIARAVAVVGLAGVALIHVLDAPGTFRDAPYRCWMYVALIVGSMVTAAALIRAGDPRAWAAAAALSLGAVVAYVLSRTVGLPHGGDDIGNWTEPLGIASLFVEGSLIAVSVIMLSGPRTFAGGLAAQPARLD